MRALLFLASCSGALVPECEQGTWHPAPLELGPSPTYLPGCPGFVPCPLGYACRAGVRNLCSPGTHTPAAGSSTCAPCPAGARCPQGVAQPCGLDASVFCPQGDASAPRAVGPGHYSTPEEGAVGARSGVAVCPLGFYCQHGLRLPCPVGRFGGQLGLASAACSGPCMGGYACPLASTQPTQLACGSQGAEAICPTGSAHGALPVLGSGGEQRDLATQLAGTELQQPPQAQLAAAKIDGEQGWQVLGGGAREALCPRGFYCPSASGAALACPAGRAGVTPGATSVLHCSEVCEAGFFCPPGSGSPRAVPCGSPAHFCPPGSALPLPVGAGNYTFSTASGALPSEVTRSGQAPCPPGSYCTKEGIALPCPSGRFAALPGHTSSACQGPCAAGFACSTPGSSTPQGDGPCTDPAYFCPLGTPRPVQVSEGHFSTSAGAAQLPCPLGYFCASGLKQQCAAGRFGSSIALSSPACSGLCAQGFYCPAGSTLPTQHACGGLSVYCPEGSGLPLPVPPGHFSVAAGGASLFFSPAFPAEPPLTLATLATPLTPTSCPAAWAASGEAAALFALDAALAPKLRGLGLSAVDPAAAAVNSTLRVAALPCPPGATCWKGQLHPCPAGRYSGATGTEAVACAHTCAPGFFCPAGSFRANQRACGNGSVVCEGGAGAPSAVAPGYYSLAGLAPDEPLLPPILCGGDADNASALLSFPTPTASSALLQQPFFASQPGHGWWPALQRTPCAASTPPGTPHAASPAVHPGMRSEQCQGALLGGERTRSKTSLCPVGHWCSAGALTACAAGRYGRSEGMADASACALCPSGAFCPPASAAPLPCSAASSAAEAARVFCPAGSAAPSPVLAGFYSLPPHPASPDPALILAALAAFPTLAVQRVDQAPCPHGYTCSMGVPAPCRAGVFGNHTGESRTYCAGLCPAGFYCPPATTSPYHFPCGNASVYCPAGSSTPTPVAQGFYTLGDTPAFPRLSAANATRSSQTQCQAGWHCAAGIARACAAGRFGDRAGLAAAGCSGPCAPGHFCPPGSTSSTPFRCGDAHLVLVDVLSSLPIQAALASDPQLPDTDTLPMLSPAFSTASLASLYAALLCSGTGAGTACTRPAIGVGSGAIAWGNWRASAPSTVTALPWAGSQEEQAAAVYGAVGVGHGSPGASAAASLALALADRQALVTALIPVGLLGNRTLSSLLGAVNASAGGGRGWGGLGGWGAGSGRTVLSISQGSAAPLFNFTASIPWNGGQRLKLPSFTLPIDSFAAMHRALLVGGPTAVYCPAGSPWPVPVAPGLVSNSSALALSAVLAAAATASAGSASALAEAAAAFAANATADGVVAAAPGWFAVGGRAEPCPPGSYNPLPSAGSPRACLPCTAGSACPLGTPTPLPCADGAFAAEGAAACTPCPAPHAGSGGLVAPVDAAEAQRQWPLGQTAAAGALGLPSAPTLLRCKTSIRCCE